jgi:hypothetical protein
MRYCGIHVFALPRAGSNLPASPWISKKTVLHEIFGLAPVAQDAPGNVNN